MEHRIMTREALEAFARALLEQERSSGTIEKYFRDVRAVSYTHLTLPTNSRV